MHLAEETAGARALRRALARRRGLSVVVVATALCLSAPAKAQEPITLTAAVGYVATAFGKAKAAYDAYKFIDQFLEPEPTTAELLAQAVLTLGNLIIDNQSTLLFADALRAINDFHDAAAVPSEEAWRRFDRDARDILNRLELTIPQDNRYANKLGAIYVALLPLYLQAHLVGSKWNIPPRDGTLSNDVVNAARVGLQLSYDMVGAKKITMPTVQDSTRFSYLFAYVKAHSQSRCFNSDDICAAYFQTNATVQAVQVAAKGLFDLLQAAGVNRPADVYDRHAHTTFTVDPEGSWSNNWQGYSDAVWTPMQERTDGVYSYERRCPSDSGIVGVWQVPYYPLMGFLCQKWPEIPPWSAVASIMVQSVDNYECSGRFCSYVTQCADPDYAEGGTMGQVQCKRRLDYQTVLPMRGSCSRMSAIFRGSNVMPKTGAFTPLPSGSYLVGYDLTIWSGWNEADYFYCSIVMPLSPTLMAPLLF